MQPCDAVKQPFEIPLEKQRRNSKRIGMIGLCVCLQVHDMLICNGKLTSTNVKLWEKSMQFPYFYEYSMYILYYVPVSSSYCMMFAPAQISNCHISFPLYIYPHPVGKVCVQQID